MKVLCPTAVVALIVVLITAFTPAPRSAEAALAASIGSVNPMTGGALCKTFTSASITHGTGSITGYIQNMLGMPQHDVKVELVRVGATGDPPTLNGGSIGGVAIQTGGT